MICPICGNPGARVHSNPTGRFVECPTCSRKILLNSWTCPVCASTNAGVKEGTNGVVLTCTACGTVDHYVGARL